MSYRDLESAATNEPIELFDFYDDLGHHWRYTSSDTEQMLFSSKFVPEPIHREPIEMSESHFKNEVNLTVGRNNPLALLYIAGQVEVKVYLTIYRMQGIYSIIYWSGVVAGVVFNADEVPMIKATPRSSDLPRIGCRRRAQILCDLALYSNECGVDKSSFSITGTLSGVSGILLTSATFATVASGWLTGGMIIIDNAKRLIQWHVSNQIKISRQIVELETGKTFTAYAGCQHTSIDCHTKFNNAINYGGIEFLPVNNPFSKSIAY